NNSYHLGCAIDDFWPTHDTDSNLQLIRLNNNNISSILDQWKRVTLGVSTISFSHLQRFITNYERQQKLVLPNPKPGERFCTFIAETRGVRPRMEDSYYVQHNMKSS